MKKLKTTMIAAALVSASPVVASERLSFLSSFDPLAVDYFRCATVLDDVIGTKRAGRLSGDVFDSSLPAVFDKAGRAAVIMASLLAEETGAKPKIKHISFTAPNTVKLIDSDISVHRRKGQAEIEAASAGSNAHYLKECSTPQKLSEARNMVEWFDKDVGLFEDLK